MLRGGAGGGGGGNNRITSPPAKRVSKGGMVRLQDVKAEVANHKGTKVTKKVCGLRACVCTVHRSAVFNWRCLALLRFGLMNHDVLRYISAVY